MTNSRVTKQSCKAINQVSKVALLLCLFFWQSQALASTQDSNLTRVRTVSLHRVGKYGGQPARTALKIKSVVLEDVRQFQDDDYHYMFQLYDPRTKVRHGDAKSSSFYQFLICTDPDIAGRLLKQKNVWKDYKINLYFNVEDRGLTFNTYVGYVYKVELLNKKGKVVETFGN